MQEIYYYYSNLIETSKTFSLGSALKKGAEVANSLTSTTTKIVSHLFFTILATIKAVGLSVIWVIGSRFWYLDPKRYSNLTHQTKEALNHAYQMLRCTNAPSSNEEEKPTTPSIWQQTIQFCERKVKEFPSAHPNVVGVIGLAVVAAFYFFYSQNAPNEISPPTDFPLYPQDACPRVPYPENVSINYFYPRRTWSPPESFFVSTANSFLKKVKTLNPYLPVLCLHGLEAAFYSRIRMKLKRNTPFLNRVNRFATKHFSSFQSVFSNLNALANIYSLVKIFDLLKGNRIIDLTSQTGLGKWLPVAALTPLIFYSSKTISSFLMNHPDLCPNHMAKSDTQIFAGTMQVASILNSLVLDQLTQNKVSLSALSIVSNIYSFFKNSKIHWMHSEQSIDFDTEVSSPIKEILIRNFDEQRMTRERIPVIRKIDTTYSALLVQKSPKEDLCGICLSEDPDQVFCSNDHVFHAKCLRNYFRSQEDNFLQNAKWELLTINHEYPNQPLRRTHHYTTNVPEENLPSCPHCREHPEENQLAITLSDRNQNSYNVRINILPLNNT